MSDLVERLQDMAASAVSLRPITAGRLCKEAADEIERLRASETALVGALEKTEEALRLAVSIIKQLPENGKHWNLLSRFWAAESDSRAAKEKQDE